MDESGPLIEFRVQLDSVVSWLDRPALQLERDRPVVVPIEFMEMIRSSSSPT